MLEPYRRHFLADLANLDQDALTLVYVTGVITWRRERNEMLLLMRKFIQILDLIVIIFI